MVDHERYRKEGEEDRLLQLDSLLKQLRRSKSLNVKIGHDEASSTQDPSSIKLELDSGSIDKIHISLKSPTRSQCPQRAEPPRSGISLEDYIKRVEGPEGRMMRDERLKRLALDTCPSRNVFTRSDVAKHNSFEDCWLIVHKKVYDVTEFIQIHPAGAASILRHGGRDASEDFEFHSKATQRLWKHFEIGRLDECTGTCIVS